MSYAAAWTIGRLIAVQDKGFSVPFYVWKRDLHHSLMASVSGAILADRLAALGRPASAATGLGSFAAAHHLVLQALKGTP